MGKIQSGNKENGTDKLKLDFEYGTLNTGTGQVIAGTNNGNVARQTITVPTETRNSVTYDSFSATQYYVYDSLNRIQIASENLTPNGQSTYQSWQQTFTYDRYGNRNFDEANTTTLPKNCGTSPNFTVCSADKKVLNPSISTTNNRLSTNDDYVFDNAGNTTQDAQGRTFIYDAENKQIEVKDSQNQTIGQYFYDGDGKRVKKYVPSTGETTIFIYDAGGKLVAEYSTVVASQQDAKVSYLTTDHLGSPRINTDQNGLVTARHDYQPFGEEITRASYGADSVRKQFATYERDKETDLDFAQARYYTKNHGRFNTPDPLFFQAKMVSDPQWFNLYSYVKNSPLNFNDPSGKEGQAYSNSDGSALDPEHRRELQKRLRLLAPGSKVTADGKIHKPGFFKRVLNRITGHGKGTDLVGRIVDSDQMNKIIVHDGIGPNKAGRVPAIQKGEFGKEAKTPSGSKIDFFLGGNNGDHDVIENGQLVKESTSNAMNSSPDYALRLSAAGLGHELIHAVAFNMGAESVKDLYPGSYNFTIGGVEYGDTALKQGEFRTVGLPGWDSRVGITENQLRSELNLLPRGAYDATRITPEPAPCPWGDNCR